MRITKLLPLPFVLLLAAASSASGARVAMEVDGNSTGSGMVDIIIQDNDGPNRIPRVPHALYEIDVVIPGGNSAPESAKDVRDTLDVELPDTYAITIVQSTIVVIENIGDIVDFQVADNVPGQSFEVVPPPPVGRPAPFAEITLVAAATGMALVAAHRLRRRRA